MYDLHPKKCRFVCSRPEINRFCLGLFSLIEHPSSPVCLAVPREFFCFPDVILSRAPVRSRVLIHRPMCLFIGVQASWLRVAYQVESSPLGIVIVPGQAHLCSSVLVYQLQPRYVPGDPRLYISVCAPRYMNLPCTHGTKLAQSTCACSLCCRGTVTRSACFKICFPVLLCLYNVYIS